MELFKGSTQDKSVKVDKDTLVEQELTGIRVKSLVELNNPLIYGNESIRIVQRSTPLLEDMKSGTGGSEAGGGLIGGKINQARDFVNSKLGIPQTQIPSRVTDKIIELSGKKELTSADPITEDIVGANGTGLGKFLKDSGGGNPATIGKQALGNGIGLVKDKLRGKLFGDGQTIGEAVGEPVQTDYNDTNKYSKVLYDNRRYDEYKEGVGYTADDFSSTQIDLTKVSPIHGVRRAAKVGEISGRFGKTEYAFQMIGGDGAAAQVYSPLNKYTGTQGQPNPYPNSLDSIGLTSNNGDKINSLSPTDDYNKEEVEGWDLIPFWISGLDSSKPVFFRTLVNGLTETVSPSWDSSNFLGNPYKYYTYSGVERSISFNLQLYCMNKLELSNNWQKIEYITKKAYPNIIDSKINPPFIKFRLGDIYNGKTGFIDSLTYTMPDNNVWETETDGLLLPKFIDVALTIKLVEVPGSEYSLYSYNKSTEAVSKIKERASQNTQESAPQESQVVSQEPITNSENTTSTNSTTEVPSINPATGELYDPKLDGSLESKTSVNKDINTGKPADTPQGKSEPIKSEEQIKAEKQAAWNQYMRIQLERQLLQDGAPETLAFKISNFIGKSNQLDYLDGRKINESAYAFGVLITPRDKTKDQVEKTFVCFNSPRRPVWMPAITSYPTWVSNFNNGVDPFPNRSKDGDNFEFNKDV